MNVATDTIVPTKWNELLKKFEDIIENDPAPAKVKDKLEALKKEASSCGQLSARQTEGINARCNNYLKGDYGKPAKSLKTD